MENKLYNGAVRAFLLLVITFFSLTPALKVYAGDSVPVLRISGSDRYATAAAISREGWKESEYILLAIGEGDDKFADALAGSPLSYALNAPVLLTSMDELSLSTKDEIVRLKAKKVVLLGGSGVISGNVERALQSMGLTTERLWGTDRNLTAIKIAERLRDINSFTKVFLTSGQEFQYAMIAAPYASRNGIPILFTEKDAINRQAAEALAKWGVNEVHIIGNTDVISQSVEDSIKKMDISVSRVSGSDIGDTNVKFIKTYKMDLSQIAIARDDVFADGLAGAAFAAVKNMPVLLTGPASAPSTVSSFIESLQFKSAYIFGGTGAVSDYIISLIRKGDNNPALYGNSCGNINSGGLAAVCDGWVYYNNVHAGGKLYKSRVDGTERTEICSDIPADINVMGDRIYYINLNDGSKIYMIRTDGTGRARLNGDECWNVSVVDNWIYYTNLSDGSSIFKISVDGTSRSKLNDTESRYINIKRDEIYYVDAGDNHAVYRMEAGSPSTVRILKNVHALSINVDGGRIYFSNLEDNGGLYATDYEGTTLTKLSGDSAFDIQVFGDTIYYSNASDGNKLYKIKTDGTGREKVYDGSAYLLTTVGDWIYFFKDKSGTELFKVKFDGTGLEEVD